MERIELEELVQHLQKRAERLERRQGRFLGAALVLLAIPLGRMAKCSSTRKP